MKREIKLDGGEITILKALGLSGNQMYGKMLIERTGEMAPAEFLETLDGLVTMGYVLSNKVNVRLIEDAERAVFRVNSAYARDLRDSMHPGRAREDKKERRQRRR